MAATNAASKTRFGCMGSTAAVLMVVAGMLLLLSPWATHMGGRWTPALMWHGYGKLHSSTGANYALFVQMNATLGSRSRHGDVNGTAILCTAKGETYNFTLSGGVYAWLSTDGKKVILHLYSPKNATPRLNFSLTGAWQGKELVLEDQGTMAMSFHEDGGAKGYLVGRTASKESAQVTLQCGKQAEFEALCHASGGDSF